MVYTKKEMVEFLKKIKEIRKQLRMRKIRVDVVSRTNFITALETLGYTYVSRKSKNPNILHISVSERDLHVGEAPWLDYTETIICMGPENGFYRVVEEKLDDKELFILSKIHDKMANIKKNGSIHKSDFYKGYATSMEDAEEYMRHLREYEVVKLSDIFESYVERPTTRIYLKKKMSKSIYEEAIEIMMNSILPRESNKTNKLKVIKAIKKAQKQEKLLGLYKKWFIKTSDYIENYSNELAGNLSYDLYCFTKQLEELENESKA